MIRLRMSSLLAAATIAGVLATAVRASPALAGAPTEPSPRLGMGIAYDAAHGQVVLFGGYNNNFLGDTWTWDGTDWTERFPTHAPSPRSDMGMAYDAAHDQVVLFGGYNNNFLGDTWTWDGTDWTQRSRAHANAPSARSSMGMAYDAAHGQVVMFGGGNITYLGDTWTWDGTDWTHRSPAHSPWPRYGMGMADDAAHGQVVLYGGYNQSHNGFLDDTWTWDGTDWTQRSPAHAPSPRFVMGMANDAAHDQVVIFGGSNSAPLNDTWTWDGTDWTRRTPAHAPSGRGGMGMADDAAHDQVVMFGGSNSAPLNDTWTWDGTDWAIPIRAWLRLTPSSGPPGTVVQVDGLDFGADQLVVVTFIDSIRGTKELATVTTDGTGAFTIQVTIPAGATLGDQKIKATGSGSGQKAKRTFTVT